MISITICLKSWIKKFSNQSENIWRQWHHPIPRNLFKHHLQIYKLGQPKIRFYWYLRLVTATENSKYLILSWSLKKCKKSFQRMWKTMWKSVDTTWLWSDYWFNHAGKIDMRWRMNEWMCSSSLKSFNFELLLRWWDKEFQELEYIDQRSKRMR